MGVGGAWEPCPPLTPPLEVLPSLGWWSWSPQASLTCGRDENGGLTERGWQRDSDMQRPQNEGHLRKGGIPCP